ncbi:hypothetical protein O9992_20470 [Vibrio lentus]|nr:hypothetical protein [Vibrio lentus]
MVTSTNKPLIKVTLIVLSLNTLLNLCQRQRSGRNYLSKLDRDSHSELRVAKVMGVLFFDLHITSSPDQQQEVIKHHQLFRRHRHSYLTLMVQRPI